MIKLHTLHLLKGRILADGTIAKGTVVPIRQQHLALSSADESDDLFYAKSDIYGRVQAIPEDKDNDITDYVYSLSKGNRSVQFLSQKIVATAFCKEPDNEGETTGDAATSTWKKRIQRLVTDKVKEKDLKNIFPIHTVNKEHFRPIKNYVYEEKTVDLLSKYFENDKTGILFPLHRFIIVLLPNLNAKLEIDFVDKEGNVVELDSLKVDKFTQQEINFTVPKSLSAKETPSSSSAKASKNKEDLYESIKIPGVILQEDPNDEFYLDEGIYTIKVIDESGNKYYNPENGKMENFYSYSSPVTFPVQTAIGDFDLIDATPISLEGSAIQQYPTEYEHIVTLAEKTEKDEDGPAVEKETSELDKFKKNVGIAKVTKGWISTIKDCYNDKQFTEVPFLQKVIEEFIAYDESLNKAKSLFDNTVTLYNSIGTVQDTWKFLKEFNKILDAAEGIDDLTSLVRLNQAYKVFSKFEDAQDGLTLMSKMQNYGIDGFKLLSSTDIADISKKQLMLLNMSHTVDPKILSELTTTASKFDLAMGYVDVALASLDLGLSVADCIDAKNSEVKAREKFFEKIENYHKVQFSAPHRQTIDIVTKHHMVYMAAEQKLSDANLAAAIAVFDTVCGALSVNPATALVGAVLTFVKTAGKAAYDLSVSGSEYLEAHASASYFAKRYTYSKVRKKFAKEVNANWKILKDVNSKDVLKKGNKEEQEKAKDMAAQVAIRAEAIRGFVSLVQRCSRHLTTFKDGKVNYKEFDKKISQYDLFGYIETYILSNNWLMSTDNNALAVGLDTVWLYDHDENTGKDFNLETDVRVAGESNKEFNYGTPIGQLISPGDKIPTDARKANFQSYFPIHKIGHKKEDINNLGHMFSQNYAGGGDLIRWTQIYCRKTPAPNSKIDYDSSWTPMYDFGEVGPDTQIRIVVVFDAENKETEKALRLIPMSFQINRLGHFSDDQELITGVGKIKGPVYKVSCGTLSIGNNELLKSESDYDGKLGVVFFPFFKFDGKTCFGPKPLKHNSEKFIGQIQSYFDNVKGPNKYEFTFKVGTQIEEVCYSRRFVDLKATMSEHEIADMQQRFLYQEKRNEHAKWGEENMGVSDKTALSYDYEMPKAGYFFDTEWDKFESADVAPEDIKTCASVETNFQLKFDDDKEFHKALLGNKAFLELVTTDEKIPKAFKHDKVEGSAGVSGVLFHTKMDAENDKLTYFYSANGHLAERYEDNGYRNIDYKHAGDKYRLFKIDKSFTSLNTPTVMTVILYALDLNEDEWTYLNKNKENHYSTNWKTTTAQATLSFKSWDDHIPIWGGTEDTQTMNAKLHFLGSYEDSYKGKDENKNFKIRQLFTNISEDRKKILKTESWQKISWGISDKKDLVELIKWGKMKSPSNPSCTNFDTSLYSYPFNYRNMAEKRPAFFAASFELKYKDKNGRIQNGIDPKLVNGKHVSLHVASNSGWNHRFSAQIRFLKK